MAWPYVDAAAAAGGRWLLLVCAWRGLGALLHELFCPPLWTEKETQARQEGE